MAKNFDPQDYQVITRKTVEDGEALFEARVAELPDVTVYGTTQAKAYRDALAVIRGLHEAAMEAGTPFPAPQTEAPQFNGRVTLRLAKSEHARAARCADREGTSLNTLISTALTKYVAECEAEGSLKKTRFLMFVDHVTTHLGNVPTSVQKHTLTAPVRYSHVSAKSLAGEVGHVATNSEWIATPFTRQREAH